MFSGGYYPQVRIYSPDKKMTIVKVSDITDLEDDEDFDAGKVRPKLIKLYIENNLLTTYAGNPS